MVTMLSEEDRTRADGIQGHATFSADRRYRYELSRWWGHEAPLTFVMLNPSTADARFDDPTIRRCMGFARREGYGGITIANLFAFRATDPRDLLAAGDPVGPDNQGTLIGLCASGRTVVAAWGAHAAHPALRAQADATRDLITEVTAAYGHHPLCLGTTAGGFPRHPLYLARTTLLVEFG
jgi:hypothetical protein